MTDIAALARERALNCEVRKIAYRQSKDGVVISLLIHPSEIPDELALAPLGQRFILAMVALNDDETPKEVMLHTRTEPVPTRNDKTPPALDSTTPARARKSWHEIPPAQQAGVLCNEPAFGKYLEKTYGYIDVCDADDAAKVVRELCDIDSRKQIKEGTPAYETWVRLAQGYRAWMREPEIVP